MKAPTYESSGSGRGPACSICGCVVDDEARHTSYHAALARILGLEGDE